MKNHFCNFLLCSFALLFACTKSSVEPAATNTTTTDLKATLTTGIWEVSSFTQKTEDKTSKFSGYTFSFLSNGKVVILKDGKESSGTWQYTPAVTYYGSSSKEAIDLNVGIDKPLSQLTRKWNFISNTSTSIKIDNPEILEEEHLQFTKK